MQAAQVIAVGGGTSMIVDSIADDGKFLFSSTYTALSNSKSVMSGKSSLSWVILS